MAVALGVGRKWGGVLRWGIIGCGAVCEVKSGPAFWKCRGSALVAVMRRTEALAKGMSLCFHLTWQIIEGVCQF